MLVVRRRTPGEFAKNAVDIIKTFAAQSALGTLNARLSKIEAGQLVLELPDYCIQDIAQTVRSTPEPLAADKKLGFKVEVAAPHTAKIMDFTSNFIGWP